MKNQDLQIIFAVGVGLIGLTTGSKKIINEDNLNSTRNTDYLENTSTLDRLDDFEDKEYYKKFHDILWKESDMNSDPFNRKLSSKTVKLFCKIAKKSGIKINDEMDKKKFDELYMKLVKYQYKLFQKNLNLDK